jgi:hypothetical protein
MIMAGVYVTNGKEIFASNWFSFGNLVQRLRKTTQMSEPSVVWCIYQPVPHLIVQGQKVNNTKRRCRYLPHLLIKKVPG